MSIKSINPFTLEVVDEYNLQSEEEIQQVIETSHNSYLLWRETSLEERKGLLLNLASELRKAIPTLAPLMTKEMGKPIKQSRAELEKCAWTAEIYSENADKWLQEEILNADGLEHKVIFQPLGVILSVMPWNFPIWQLIRFAVPTLLVGNTAILKHSNLVPGSALEIERIFKRAGFPKGVFSTIIASHKSVEMILSSRYVQGVSLTGSTEAGARIAEIAGRNLKRVVLELGGSDPFIVCEDVNMDFVIRNAVIGRTQNNGQSCIAAKRFIVHEKVANEFTERLAEAFAKLKVGDPLEEDVDIGPLSNKQGYEEVRVQLEDAKKKGAKIIGANNHEGNGYTVTPTLVLNPTADMKVVREEVFGPVAPILTFRTDDEAIKIANDTEFGLGGSVWTKNLERGKRFAEKIECGTVFVNSIVKSDPRVPFGGVKMSGIGRELSHYGLKEFVNIKAVNVYTHPES